LGIQSGGVIGPNLANSVSRRYDFEELRSGRYDFEELRSGRYDLEELQQNGRERPEAKMLVCQFTTP
jgi:hypothetical protein